MQIDEQSTEVFFSVEMEIPMRWVAAGLREDVQHHQALRAMTACEQRVAPGANDMVRKP
jgi:hypothetical protein